MDSNWPPPAPSCSPTLGRQGILSLFPGGGAQETGQAGHCVLWGGGRGKGWGVRGAICWRSWDLWVTGSQGSLVPPNPTLSASQMGETSAAS